MKLLNWAALLVLALALPLAGCTTLSQIGSAWSTVTDASVSPKAVAIAVNGFDAGKATMTNIIVFCTPNPAPAGCDDALIRKGIAAIRSGTKARDGLEAFLTAHPGQLGSKGLYDALTSATATLTDVISTYKGAGA